MVAGHALTLARCPAIFRLFESLPMASVPFGEHLKRERAMRGVSLQEISAATCINIRFLEAMENGQWAQLPGGAFNRGFIRTVARFLGLDDDQMIADYMLETSGQPQIRVPVKDPNLPKRVLLAPLATLLLAGLATLLLVALLEGSWLAYRHYGTRLLPWHHSKALARPAPAVGAASPSPQPDAGQQASRTPTAATNSRQDMPPASRPARPRRRKMRRKIPSPRTLSGPKSAQGEDPFLAIPFLEEPVHDQ
jgi:cytoskeleton protein RodZ